VLTLVDAGAPGWLATIAAQPAAVTVPAAFLVMVLVSLLTPSRVPPHVSRTMVRLHTPEHVELDRGPLPL
jgi:cation/acetate symporter